MEFRGFLVFLVAFLSVAAYAEKLSAESPRSSRTLWLDRPRDFDDDDAENRDSILLQNSRTEREEGIKDVHVRPGKVHQHTKQTWQQNIKGFNKNGANKGDNKNGANNKGANKNGANNKGANKNGANNKGTNKNGANNKGANNQGGNNQQEYFGRSDIDQIKLRITQGIVNDYLRKYCVSKHQTDDYELCALFFTLKPRPIQTTQKHLIDIDNQIPQKPLIHIDDQITQKPVIDVDDQITQKPVIDVDDQITQKPVTDIDDQITQKPLIPAQVTQKTTPYEQVTQKQEFLSFSDISKGTTKNGGNDAKFHHHRNSTKSSSHHVKRNQIKNQDLLRKHKRSAQFLSNLIHNTQIYGVPFRNHGIQAYYVDPYYIIRATADANGMTHEELDRIAYVIESNAQARTAALGARANSGYIGNVTVYF